MSNVPTLTTGNKIAGIIPTDMDQMWRMAQAISKSGLGPASMKTTEQVFIAIQMGMEIGLPPMQALRGIAVINGRPALWGDVMWSMVRHAGHRFREWYEGEGADLTAFCELTRGDTGEKITSYFSMADAKAAGLLNKTGPWQQYTRRMLMMRARSWSCRDGAPDALGGMPSEFDVIDITPDPVEPPIDAEDAKPPKPAAAAKAAPKPPQAALSKQPGDDMPPIPPGLDRRQKAPQPVQGDIIDEDGVVIDGGPQDEEEDFTARWEREQAEMDARVREAGR